MVGADPRMQMPHRVGKLRRELRVPASHLKTGWMPREREREREMSSFLRCIKTVVSFLRRIFHCCGDRKPDPRPWDPPFDPSQPSIPISYPITTLEALAARSYFRSFHYPFNRSSVPLPPSAAALPPRRRILVCHDMKGGYTDDLWVQGGGNPDAYAIWHWHLMDVFVYFSHYLVTLPPPCWTNAAHTHGVKVLGTFLTEWDEGRDICDTLLLSKESSQMYAERLTELATTLGFDGWLVNIEVKLDRRQIDNLKEFVGHLSRSMHASVPGSLVIWYDSVTIDGKLDWQNQLNMQNKPFFDLCDGIFVNYTWKDEDPKSSASIAGERRFDVYMGIDVFGRNTFGGGQWHTNVALDVLKKDDVSAAIFAPGWVYETEQEPDFQTAQNRWWGLVEQSWGILQNYPIVLPFYSTFDQGHGYHYSIKGLQVANDPWNNISSQSFQPLLSNGPSSSTVEACINFKDASYCGGGSITAKGNLENNSFFSTKLFHGQLQLEDQPVNISYSVRSDENSLFGLYLELWSEISGKTSILIAADTQPFSVAGLEYSRTIKPQIKDTKADVLADAAWLIYEVTLTMSGYMLGGIYLMCALKNPDRTNIEMEKSPIGENTTSENSGFLPYRASLGHIRILNTEPILEFPPAKSWVIQGHDISWILDSEGNRSLNLKVTWKLKEGYAMSFTRYNVYVQRLMIHTDGNISDTVPSYVGFARVEAFFLSKLGVPTGVTALRFIVQACGVHGTCQQLDESPTLELAVEC
ncbi:Glycosyl hydrolase family 85 [Musa troglodytarum]|uniref:mannosyl-glycoprotein endo-beta-N-acetylglucosaminidase n=1 Tax=Musa troglodytarum TaxID=320322 RepID=A0A9E7GBX8_9LILI|nr:Glycosyl hydrolase family 85 [Musa troglodytarum]